MMETLIVVSVITLILFATVGLISLLIRLYRYLEHK